MGVYRLEPITGKESSHHWEASTLPPITVWVEAAGETEARETLNTATIIATAMPRRDGRETPMAPWKDFGLVRCVPDASRSVQEGTS